MADTEIKICLPERGPRSEEPCFIPEAPAPNMLDDLAELEAWFAGAALRKLQPMRGECFAWLAGVLAGWRLLMARNAEVGVEQLPRLGLRAASGAAGRAFEIFVADARPDREWAQRPLELWRRVVALRAAGGQSSLDAMASRRAG